MLNISIPVVLPSCFNYWEGRSSLCPNLDYVPVQALHLYYVVTDPAWLGTVNLRSQ